MFKTTNFNSDVIKFEEAKTDITIIYDTHLDDNCENKEARETTGKANKITIIFVS